jgi:predicted transcriptional regulator
MTTIHVRVPDPLARQVAELAEQEKVSVDQLVSIALAYQVSAWRKRDARAERAKRGSWEKFDRAMAKVRDVPPLSGDEL